jgi:hypothetical protein
MSTAWLRPPLEQRPRAFIFTGNLCDISFENSS